MAEGKTFLLRSAVFVGLASVVTTIIYFTPVPDIDFASCERPCHELEWPMICRVKLIVEVYQPLSSACGSCPWNATDCLGRHCVTADGLQQPLITVNRQLPGPSIHVCENDILLVEVVNRVPGAEMSVHWRGQPQRETPVMDGVPGVTQCAVPALTTFQYKFRASRAGTHLWHAFTGLPAADTVLGALVVRRSDSTEPQRRLYDRDERDHLLVVTQLAAAAALLSVPGAQLDGRALLVNGRAQGVGDPPLPLHTFWVSGGARRYRFRMANGGGGAHCPVNITVQGHRMLVIALDGSPIQPRHVGSLVIASGERADVVLTADHPSGSVFHLLVNTVQGCGSKQLHGAALLKYRDGGPPSGVPEGPIIVNNPRTAVTLWSSYSPLCDGDQHLCLPHVKALEAPPEELSAPALEHRLVLPFGTHHADRGARHIGNLSFVLPSSPLLTQRDDVPREILCVGDAATPPSDCDDSSVRPCRCSHVRQIPLGAALELVLVNQDESDSTIHVHGNPAYVVGVGQLSYGANAISPNDVAPDYLEEAIKAQLVHPPLKDTITVPGRGVAVLRLKASNPGYWLLHDQRPSYWTAGLAVLLQVGESSDLPSAPSDFPRCGSWVGPEFLLI